MKRTPLWQSIAAELRAEIGGGCFSPGHRLPTEAALAARFGVNRHTVRRALAALVEEALVHTRRGSGAFVTARPTEYRLGRRVRFNQNLRAAGQVPGKAIHGIETRPAAVDEAEALALEPGAAVHCCHGVALADGQPIAVFRSVFPAAAMPMLPDHLLAEPSVSRALVRVGISDYTRRTTRLTAVAATAAQALHLRLREGAPLLQSVAINVDGAGRPVEHGKTWFAGETVTLTVETEPE
jgi:GntR family phosphonate transport system transcriptional regulator